MRGTACGATRRIGMKVGGPKATAQRQRHLRSKSGDGVLWAGTRPVLPRRSCTHQMRRRGLGGCASTDGFRPPQALLQLEDVKVGVGEEFLEAMPVLRAE